MSELRRIRIDRRLSIVQLAERSEVSPEQIRNIENGRARNPRVETLDKLARVLGVLPSAIDPKPAAAPPNVTTPPERAA